MSFRNHMNVVAAVLAGFVGGLLSTTISSRQPSSAGGAVAEVLQTRRLEVVDQEGRVRVALASGNHPQLEKAFESLSKIKSGGLVVDPRDIGPGLFVYDALGKIRIRFGLSSTENVWDLATDQLDMAETQMLFYPVRDGDGKVGLYGEGRDGVMEERDDDIQPA